MYEIGDVLRYTNSSEFFASNMLCAIIIGIDSNWGGPSHTYTIKKISKNRDIAIVPIIGEFWLDLHYIKIGNTKTIDLELLETLYG